MAGLDVPAIANPHQFANDAIPICNQPHEQGWPRVQHVNSYGLR